MPMFLGLLLLLFFFNLLHLCPGLRGLISGVWLLVLLMGEDFLCADAGCEIRDFWFPWSEPPTKRLSPLVARLQQQRWLPAAQACLPSRQVLYVLLRLSSLLCRQYNSLFDHQSHYSNVDWHDTKGQHAANGSDGDSDCDWGRDAEGCGLDSDDDM